MRALASRSLRETTPHPSAHCVRSHLFPFWHFVPPPPERGSLSPRGGRLSLWVKLQKLISVGKKRAGSGILLRLLARRCTEADNSRTAGKKNPPGGPVLQSLDGGQAQIRLSASSSPTRMKSGCICRMLAGTSGVTGPKNAFLMISALPTPLATIRTLRACMMVLMPMV